MQNAFVFSGDDVKDIEINFGMHKNIIEGLEAAGSNLQHVYFNSGGKWYGKITVLLDHTYCRKWSPW